ncbi:MAG: PAS domain-containing protein [Negativicutes bacterium]|nr:PAS domain-containing protein [Negativicutes bacterium]
MKRRIFRAFCLLSLFAVLLSGSLFFAVVYREVSFSKQQEVRNELVLVRTGFTQGSLAYLQTLQSAPERNRLCRITWISAGGVVLFDNYETAAAMENHLDRPEIISALQNGSGEALRMSSTLHQQTYYYAERLTDGTVLRLALTTASIWATLFNLLPSLLLIISLVILLALWLARHETQAIIQPINAINLQNPLEQDTYDELAPLLLRIEQQNKEIAAKMAELSQTRLEFITITENMSNGLILLNQKEEILTINRSACRILNLKADQTVGRKLLTQNRSSVLQNLLQQVEQGEIAEAVLQQNQHSYQLLAHPVLNKAELQGIVLLISDITEQQATEQLRREFAANVSHELKTPLQSISGYAEIISNHLVKAEDIPEFVDRIYREARRLIVLVDDIMKISRLDESKPSLAEEPVDLYLLTQDILQRLQPQAEAKQVRLELKGVPAEIQGVRQILDEMIFNLCDNAIKYNKQGGRVDVIIERLPSALRLRVIDTGIGIAPEDQEHVFERFYRADKSHSQKISGTGLGLSIVKHGARYHHAEIELQSIPNQGTAISLSFPLSNKINL